MPARTRIITYDTYIVQPWQLSPRRIRSDVALKVNIIALFDVVYNECRAEP